MDKHAMHQLVEIVLKGKKTNKYPSVELEALEMTNSRKFWLHPRPCINCCIKRWVCFKYKNK